MSVKIGINGFGRIGRLVFRAIVEQGLLGKDVEVVAVNDLVPADNLAYLLKYDSTQGRFTGQVFSEKSKPDLAEDDVLVVNGSKIKCLAVKEGPAALPWKDLGVDIVIESTGLFTEAEKAKGPPHRGGQEGHHQRPGQGRRHHGGRRRQPHQVRGLQAPHHLQRELHHQLPRPRGPCPPQGGDRHRGRADDHHPQLHGDPEDGRRPLEEGLEGGRSAAINIIPSTTGAAKAVGLVIPEVKGKLTGMSFRVPTPTVSVVDSR